MSKVKEKQDQDPILLDLKEGVHNQRVLTFEQGGDKVIMYQDRLCMSKDDGLMRGSLRRLIALDIQFIWVAPRHTTI